MIEMEMDPSKEPHKNKASKDKKHANKKGPRVPLKFTCVDWCTTSDTFEELKYKIK